MSTAMEIATRRDQRYWLQPYYDVVRLLLERDGMPALLVRMRQLANRVALESALAVERAQCSVAASAMADALVLKSSPIPGWAGEFWSNRTRDPWRAPDAIARDRECVVGDAVRLIAMCGEAMVIDRHPDCLLGLVDGPVDGDRYHEWHDARSAASRELLVALARHIDGIVRLP